MSLVFTSETRATPQLSLELFSLFLTTNSLFELSNEFSLNSLLLASLSIQIDVQGCQKPSNLQSWSQRCPSSKDGVATLSVMKAYLWHCGVALRRCCCAKRRDCSRAKAPRCCPVFGSFVLFFSFSLDFGWVLFFWLSILVFFILT